MQEPPQLGGKKVSADTYGKEETFPISSEFTLSPEELEKGQRAAETFLSGLKPIDRRRNAEEALDTLAAVISGGYCDHSSFPWQQLRSHHGTLALSFVKERGAPAKIETLRCRANDSRKFQQVPENYHSKQVRLMRQSLIRVIDACSELGFINADERELAVPPIRGQVSDRKVSGERTLTDGEVRALLSACNMDSGPKGPRDSLVISLAYSGGLKTVDLINLTLASLLFDGKTGQVTIRYKAPGTKRMRKVALHNSNLISLEDWLEYRGREPGPLLCPVKSRGKQHEYKRLSASDVREICAKRGELAGVIPFAPNDLARSGTLKAEAARKKKLADDREEAQIPVLYEDLEAEATTQDVRQLSFPSRVGLGD
jgi:site-specific recombinase XerC